LDQARLVAPQDAIGLPELVGPALMLVPLPLLLIPAPSTAAPRHPTDGAPLDLEGHGLERLAGALTSLAHPRVEAMAPRRTAGQTVVDGRLQRPPCLHAPFHIAGDNIQRGHGPAFAGSPTGWSHPGPPGDPRGRQEERSARLRSRQIEMSL